MKVDDQNVLGLEQKIVRLHDYTPLWASLYQQEEENIRAAIGHLIIDIQHIGSTAIPGIKAKPIIDIMVGIEQLESALQCQRPLKALGYEYAPWADIPGDYVFGKGVIRTHLVHVVEHGGAHWANNLDFRDALRSDPKLAREYEELKVQLSRRFSDNRAAYTEAKSEFIGRVLAADRFLRRP